MINESKIINTIKEIKKDRDRKLDEIKDCKNKLTKLNEQVDELDIKISWLKEDIEDIFCNYFDSIKRIHINKEITYIEVEFAIASKIRLSRIEDFINMIGKELEDCVILCDADGSLYLQITL